VSASDRCPWDGNVLEEAFRYAAPPAGETRFAPEGTPYERVVLRCPACGHFVSHHDMDLGALYAGDYVGATYGDRMRATFEKIVALPPERSDNAGRVTRVDAYARERGLKPDRALDIGSGLCVFLHRLAQHGWQGTAVDPDARAVAHAREVVGVNAICGDFLALDDLGQFELVTLNKVLEHVDDPTAMLSRAGGLLSDGGLVYVEVPDGEAAAADGSGREEFFIEHLHVFSPASLAMLAARAGLSPLRIDRIREPSTKYTLVAFLEAAP
jgi:SAM-dependent methyltransferase